MIKYSLLCRQGHQFSAWFKGSADYDRQAKRGLVTCPDCGSSKVEKAIMAPSVASRGRDSGERRAAATNAVAPQDAARLAELRREMAALVRKVRQEVERTAEYVGPRFAEEARKIHYEEAEPRGIYGEASAKEVEALHEDGIECYPLPALPEDQN
jgi:hypothetical protein